MSGDTPTAKPSLDCPGCGSEVFIRDVAAWYTDDEELCAGCGSRVMVALDEDDADPDMLTARVYIYEHGGEVVARLLADIEYLQTRPAQGVSEGLRACVEAAGQACLDGEVDCVKAGCVVGHQAGEILDAYDDAAADVERLTKRVLTIEQDAARKIMELSEPASFARAEVAQADVERLTEERDAIWAERVEEGKVAARAGREAAELRTRAEQAEAAHSAAAEALLVAVSWLLDMGADSTTGNADCIERLAAHRVAEYAIKRAGRVGAYTVVGATPREPGNAEYIAWSDGGMVGPAPGHGEPACSRCKDTGVTRSVSVDMSGKPGPPSRCPCTVDPDPPDPDDMHGACDGFGGSDF